MSEELGGNAAAVLKGIISDIVKTHQRIAVLKGRIKEAKQELKDEGLPASALVKVSKLDPEKAEKAASNLETAGAILGKSVWTGEVSPGELPEVFSKTEGLIELVKTKLEEILEDEGEIEGCKAGIKALLKAAKEQGFNPKAIEKVVEFKLNPKNLEMYRRDSLALNSYLNVAE